MERWSEGSGLTFAVCDTMWKSVDNVVCPGDDALSSLPSGYSVGVAVHSIVLNSAIVCPVTNIPRGQMSPLDLIQGQLLPSRSCSRSHHCTFIHDLYFFLKFSAIVKLLLFNVFNVSK